MGFNLFKPLDALFGDNNPPPAPDYMPLAEQSAEANREAAQEKLYADRPNEYTPYGSRTWQQHPNQYSPGKTQWTATTSLTPEAQEIFDTSNRMNLGMAQLGEQSVGQMQGLFAEPFSIEGQAPTYRGAQGNMPQYQGAQGNMPQYQGAQGDMPQFQGPEGELGTYGQHRQGVVNAMMSRVNTDIARDRASKNSQLIAKGIPVGSEAYNREMEQLDRKQTDARQQAEIAAEGMAGMGYASDISGRRQMGVEGLADYTTGMDTRNQYNQEGMTDYTTGMDTRNQYNREGMADYTTGMDTRNQYNREGMTDFTTAGQTRQQNIQEALLPRNQLINERTAFDSGSQIGMPQFQPYGQQQFTPGADYMGAGQMSGAWDMAGYNAGTAQDNALLSGLFGLGSAGTYGWANK